MQGADPGTAGRGVHGAETAGLIPDGVRLVEAYEAARREFVRASDEVRPFADALVGAERALVAHLEVHGELALSHARYKVDADGDLRYRKVRGLEGWRAYATHPN